METAVENGRTKQEPKESRALYSVIVSIAKIVVGVVKLPKVYGKENMAQLEGRIIMCNHRLWWDPVLVAAIAPRHLHFMAKKELLANGFLAWLAKKLGVIPINRGTPDLKAIKASMDVIERGETMLIFPEGTRNKNGGEDMLEFHKGVAFLSVKCGADVVPVFIHKDRIKLRTVIDIGAPLDTAGLVKGASKREQIENVNEGLKKAMLALEEAH